MIIHHCIPVNLNEYNDGHENDEDVLIPFKSKTFYWPKNCDLLIEENSLKCKPCPQFSKNQRYRENKRQVNLATPAKPKVPISKTNPQKVVLTLRGERLKCAQLTKELKDMKIELEKKNVYYRSQINQWLGLNNVWLWCEHNTIHESVLATTEKIVPNKS